MWMPAAEAPDGVVVMTKIDDANGCRNETTLKRSGNMWFVPDGSMYVYYCPTHYRRLTAAEQQAEVANVQRSAKAMAEVANGMKF